MLKHLMSGQNRTYVTLNNMAAGILAETAPVICYSMKYQHCHRLINKSCCKRNDLFVCSSSCFAFIGNPCLAVYYKVGFFRVESLHKAIRSFAAWVKYLFLYQTI